MKFPVDALKKWFLETKRDFPWRENPTPYRVWISEVMLQQTQASVVIPYFERWMNHFPNLEDLAKAPIEDVIKLWEGLGYYRRARHLHEGAKQILLHFGGQFPSEKEKLMQIKGIGKYTCGAILSFAFNKKAPCCDGNVYRLISRFCALDDPIDLLSTQKSINEKVATLLPEEEPWIISEGLIELGATVCQKKALCLKCPIKNECRAYQLGVVDELPHKSKEKEILVIHRTVAVVKYQDEYLIKKGEKGKVMGELYEFPFVETKDLEEAFPLFEKEFGKLDYVGALPMQKHSFTRFRAFLYPHLFHIQEKKDHFFWSSTPHEFPFSSGHRRILQSLTVHENFTH